MSLAFGLLLALVAASPGVARAEAPASLPLPESGEGDGVVAEVIGAPPPVAQYTITLITGDRLYVTRTDGGPWAVAVDPAPRPWNGVPFRVLTDDNLGTFVIPADALRFVPHVLDPYFFNVDYLIENGLHDETMPVLSAIVESSDPAAVAEFLDSNLVRASELPLVESVAVSASKDHADEFASLLWTSLSEGSASGIDRIWLNRIVHVDLDVSVPRIGATAVREELGLTGAGVNLAVLDTGVDSSHPDFFVDGVSKFVRDLDMTCSVEPIIFCDETPVDLHGHGTHVASTALGTGAASEGRFVGVAPGAGLLNVKVLNRFGFGFFSWIIKGMEVAALGTDDVRGNEPEIEADIVSMSLGGGPTDGTDPASLMADRLVDEWGVVTVIAAGNFGSYFGVGNPGSATQVITVGATTKAGVPIAHELSPTDRFFETQPMVFSPPLPEGGIEGEVVFAGLGTSGEFAGIDAAGKIALIERGLFTFRQKALNAADAGATAALIYNNVPGPLFGTLISPGVPIPVLGMSREDGLALRDDVDAGPTVVRLELTPQPVIGSLSSRGPRVDNFDIKPNIVAPGIDIFAACSSAAEVIVCPPDSQYTSLSGTSMATPHVSGVVALLLEKDPTLAPQSVKDLLQSSAEILLPATAASPDVDVYSQGAGLVRADRAAKADVLVSPAELSFGVVPLTESSLSGTLAVTNDGNATRTFQMSVELRDVLTSLSPLATGDAFDHLVTLTPSEVTLDPGQSADIAVEIDVAGAPTQKLWSLFSGRILIEDETGEVAHAILGFAKEGARQSLHLSAIRPDGTAASSESFSFYDAEDPLGLIRFFELFDEAGERQLRLPLSTYNVIMDFFEVEQPDPEVPEFIFRLTRVTELEVRVVDVPEARTLDARTAGEVRLATPSDPRATAGLQQDALLAYIREDGSSIGSGFIIIGTDWDRFAVNEDAASGDLGTLWVYDRWVRVREPAESSEFLYDLTLTRNVQAPTTHTVSAEMLKLGGRTRAHFHTDAAGLDQFGRFAFPGQFFFGIAISGFHPIATPLVRQEFQTPGDVFRQFVLPGPGFFWFDTKFTTDYFGFTVLGKVWAPRELLFERWAQQPVHPIATSVTRTGALLAIRGFEVVDHFGHFGLFIFDRGVAFSLTVFVNGTQAAVSPTYSANVIVPAGTADVELVALMSADPAWSMFSQPTVTSVGFQTTSGADGPISVLRNSYRLGLTLLNVATADVVHDTAKVEFNVDFARTAGGRHRIVEADVLVSTDDGETWSPAGQVGIGKKGLTVNVETPLSESGSTFLSLRIDVATSEGQPFHQTIIRAIQIVP